LAKLQAQLSASSNESKLVNEVNKVLLSDDFDYFQDLIGKDKVMANRVIEKIAKQKGIEIEEVKKLLMKDVQPKTINPEDIELKVKETIAKQE
jgi:DNA-binding phage protein